MTTNDILIQLVGNGNKTHFSIKHGIDRVVLGTWLNHSRNIKTATLEKIAHKEGYKIINEIKLVKL